VKYIQRSFIVGCSLIALAGCGADEIVSPGTGGNVTINNSTTTNNPAPAPAPTPTPTQSLVTAANGCPTLVNGVQLTDENTITGPTGTYRVCALPLTINDSTRLPRIDGLLYRLAGQTLIGTDGGAAPSSADTNVTLTIDPGVIIYASGSSYLASTRGNKLVAKGTRERPIIFTSRDNVLGLAGEESSSQWGGVVMLGRGQVTDCIASGSTPGTNDCEFALEGSITPARGGGTTNTDDNGELEFVQIRFSGFILGQDNELQGLTTIATGSGTKFDYIQSVNSSDDGVEFFGGTVNMKHLIVYGSEDDSLDVDVGVKSDLQYVILSQRAVGDTLIESDSSNGGENDDPRTQVRMANATMIQRVPNDQALRFRGGSDFTIVNSVLVDASGRTGGTPCLRIDDEETVQATGPDERGTLVFRSMGIQCESLSRNGSFGGPDAAGAAALFTGDDSNDVAFTITLTSGYLNGANETGFTPIFDNTSLSSFFEATTFIGAVDPADDWTAGWTCNMDLLTFVPGNTGSCTTLPVFS
jgi:hypothetical protein